jgi:hypothetical protein
MDEKLAPFLFLRISELSVVVSDPCMDGTVDLYMVQYAISCTQLPSTVAGAVDGAQINTYRLVSAYLPVALKRRARALLCTARI